MLVEFKDNFVVPSQTRNSFNRSGQIAKSKSLNEKKCSKKEKENMSGVQHEDFPRRHLFEYYSHTSMLNFGVLIGSGTLVLI